MKCILKTKKTKTIITILLCIFSLFYLSTIAYSAFSSTMNIKGIAFSRVEADVRITNFKLDSIVNATSQYEEFGKDTVSSSIKLEENAYVTYKVEVTNYGNTYVGIYSIEGFPENLDYEIIDYNLQEPLCNINGKCNNYATKVFYIKFSGSNTTETFTLNFNFKIFHSLTYINFTKEYKSSIIDSGSLSIDLSEDSPKFVSVYPSKHVDYTYENNILNINNVTGNLTIEAIDEYQKDYSYTGSTQTFTVPYDGLYKIELWGAQGGGTSSYPGGKGGYTSGEIYLNKDDNLYIYVGQNGNGTTTVYNNGGKTRYHSYSSTSNGYGYSGGGGTDVRTTSGNWYDFESIKSRIMVASGGGGSNTYHSQYSGAAGGGLIGYSGTTKGTDGITATGGEQTQGGKNGGGAHLSSLGARNLFGVALYYYKSTSAYLGAGGGGYYFGGNGPHGDSTTGSGAGGSSFISGHNGCDAIEDESTESKLVHTGQSIHYSTYIFRNTKMIDGQGYSWTTSKESKINMPTQDGTSTMTGNEGNGYAKVTLVDTKIIYDIRYIDIEGTYPTTIKKEDDLIIDFGENSPPKLKIYKYDEIFTNYSYKKGKLIIENVDGSLKIENDPIIYAYEYTGDVQTFTVPSNAIYKVELWGAQGGGDSTYIGGYGGYTSGNTKLIKNEKLYVYVGEHGVKTSTIFNNGSSSKLIQSKYGYAGGGSTDIRLVSGKWNDFDSLKSRIMVAAAGGGASVYYYQASGSAAGGLTGYSGTLKGTDGVTATGGTQTKAGKNGRGTNIGSSFAQYNKFGIVLHSASAVSSAGNGYYAGGNGAHGSSTVGTGGSGSSFISGHEGCNAIDYSSTEDNIIHTNQSIHYSDYKFTDTKMIDGQGYNWTTSKGSKTNMPTQDGESTMTGNTGHGYAKITLIKYEYTYNIKYTDIAGNYQTTIESDDDLIIDFKENAPLEITVKIDNEEITDYTYENGILIIKNVYGNIEIKKKDIISTYNYTGDYQEFIAPYTATYKIELWGAQGGGDNDYSGGMGGYTSGNILLQKGDKLYVYVGESGPKSLAAVAYDETFIAQDIPYETSPKSISINLLDNKIFNNGGQSLYVNDKWVYAGGGSTDIRLVSGSWDNFDSLKSRIMVASSGSGANIYHSSQAGISAGGLTGYDGEIYQNGSSIEAGVYALAATAPTQTQGGANAIGGHIKLNGITNGYFGKTQFLYLQMSGPGNGYYAGGVGVHGKGTTGTGSSGNSFISGHNGCDAIAVSSTESNIIHTGQSVHYSNYSFTDTKMIDGYGYNWTDLKQEYIGMPTHDGNGTMTGNTGNGYAKITLIEAR